MRRTRGREVALQTLYQKELNPSVGARWINTFVRRRLKNSPSLLEFTKSLIAGVEENKAYLDERIQASSDNWRLDRMPALDRNVLRIGLYEIQNGGEETPPAVALDEAVQLAKRYGTDQSGKFVNGLLDRFMPGKQPPPMPPIVSEIPDEPSESDLAETAPEVSDDDKTDPVASDDTETAQKAADSAPLAE